MEKLQSSSDQTEFSDDAFESRRDAIDLIATLRARSVRVALFGNYVSQSNQANLPTYLRESYIAAITEQIDSMEDVCAICLGTPPKSPLADNVLEWIHELAKKNPEVVSSIVQMTHLSRTVLEACHTEDENLTDALNEHFKFGRNGFSDTITSFCNQLWESIDEERKRATAKASQATKTVSEMLTRLEYIGRHVRLVSLNASVEAARAGDAGRGLAVIATEFKTLAEEIQTLANGAREQIDTI